MTEYELLQTIMSDIREMKTDIRDTKDEMRHSIRIIAESHLNLEQMLTEVIHINSPLCRCTA